MHISTLTLTLVLLIACVGFNNAQFDHFDSITPVCCKGDNFEPNCPSRTCAQTWWGPQGDCRFTYGPMACKDGKFVGYSRNPDGITWSYVEKAELEQRWQTNLQECYLGDTEVYNGAMGCILPIAPGCLGATGPNAAQDSKGSKASETSSLSGLIKANAVKEAPTEHRDK